MKILAIETSCDETALAVLEANGGLKQPAFRIIKNIIASQIDVHKEWGGVVPNLAKREHIRNLPILLKKIIKEANFLKSKIKSQKSKIHIKNKNLSIDMIAVTVGPGLEPCLWTGINFTKEIHKKYFPKSKITGVNHLEGHLYSFLLSQKRANSKFSAEGRSASGGQIPRLRRGFGGQAKSKIFPAAALIVSGGHTILLLMQSLTKWKKLGETRDDAAGEAFDKVARMLDLPYPGGPKLEKLAEKGSTSIDFPRPMINQKNYDFSFAGLKTAVFYYLNKLKKNEKEELKADIAASFQEAVIDVLIQKTITAAKEFEAKTIFISGGVAANQQLRKQFLKECRKNKFLFFAPAANLNTDNAAVIAVAAYLKHFQNKNRLLSAQPNLNL